ncbi:hypothetical protein [Sutcliffiella cohnii]|uniref:hypothetical protein n=1 Tax=Sutcliffiella cohnii TaxID=33932 RepID=UPI00082C68F6|nr:hypothetical protein [Sutcliffiella cohnii]
MELFKGRKVESGMSVDIYRNLHHGGYSIRCSRTKVVLARCDSVRIKDCEFRVSETGRQKVLATRRKSVHAYIKGIFIAADESPEQHSDMSRVIYYNPYETEHFMDVTTGTTVKRLEEVFCHGKVVFAKLEGGNENSITQEQLALL